MIANSYSSETGRKVHICADFCRMVYKSCKTAEYDGHDIGKVLLRSFFFCMEINEVHVLT